MKFPEDDILQSVQHWFEQSVLGLNLCPFAHKPHRQGSILFEISDAETEQACLHDLQHNLARLDQDPDIETLVMICSRIFTQFDDYNQFLDVADRLLVLQGWEGVYQIASFHPDYRFEGCAASDRGNWTNRSPYPLFHLIREQSVSRALSSHPDVEAIPETNRATLSKLNDAQMKRIYPSFKPD